MRNDFESDLKEEQEVEVRKPKMYNVLLLNDDFTPMDFVMEMLISIFGHTPERAYEITMDIHNKDKGVCGSYIKSIADAKSKKVNQISKERQFVLKSIVEEA